MEHGCIDRLWQQLVIGTLLARLAADSRRDPMVERVVFTLVANRALAPSSTLAATSWLADPVDIPGIDTTNTYFETEIPTNRSGATRTATACPTLPATAARTAAAAGTSRCQRRPVGDEAGAAVDSGAFTQLRPPARRTSYANSCGTQA
ncbi:MAG: hypothetical protein JNM77_17780 [Pseudonocardia sp.]|nr:hypothetical protein [Pseudonocardia sp.]